MMVANGTKKVMVEITMSASDPESNPAAKRNTVLAGQANVSQAHVHQIWAAFLCWLARRIQFFIFSAVFRGWGGELINIQNQSLVLERCFRPSWSTVEE